MTQISDRFLNIEITEVPNIRFRPGTTALEYIVGPDVSFYYTDTGPLTDPGYTTLIIIHGHTFHSGINRRLELLAKDRMRVISVNRREYPGSTPYTLEERLTFIEGSETELKELVHAQGVLLALFIDGLIQQLSLPEKIALVGWSLGVVFFMSCIASIKRVPDAVKARLTAHIKHFLLLDPPSVVFGILVPQNAYTPLRDYDLPEETRVAAFGAWCSGYYQQPDISASQDFSKLNQRLPDPLQQASIDRMTREELASVADFTSDLKYETLFLEPRFIPVLSALTLETLFNPELRNEWNNPQFSYVYATASTWSCLYAVWDIQGRAQDPNNIWFKAMEGANHFFMWDEPENTLDILQQCLHL